MLGRIRADRGTFARLPALGPARAAIARQAFGLADQAVVSGTSFVLLLLLARTTTPAEVGLYATAVAVVMVVASAQDALVTRPLTIRYATYGSRAANHAAAAALLGGFFALAAGALLGIGVMLAAATGHDSTGLLAPMALVAALPALLARELARRLAFARLATGSAFALDLAVSALALAGAVAAALLGRLSAATMLGVLAAAACAGTAVWLGVTRHALASPQGLLRAQAHTSWSLGRWLVVGTASMQLQGYAAYGILLALAGAAATGIYAACMSLVGLANPIIYAFFNLATARYGRCLHDEGRAALVRRTLADTALFAIGFFVFWLTLHHAGAALMTFVFARPDYVAESGLLSWLAAALAISVVGGPSAVALAVADHAKTAAGIAAAAAAATVALVTVLTAAHGLSGAAVGVVIGETIGALCRLAALRLVLRPTKGLAGAMPAEPVGSPGR